MVRQNCYFARAASLLRYIQIVVLVAFSLHWMGLSGLLASEAQILLSFFSCWKGVSFALSLEISHLPTTNHTCLPIPSAVRTGMSTTHNIASNFSAKS